VFPPDAEDGLWHVLSRYFVPEDNLRTRAARDRVPYDPWGRQGFIEARRESRLETRRAGLFQMLR
jgi:hypothetical protein